MKITKSQLKQIIREEKKKVLSELTPAEARAKNAAVGKEQRVHDNAVEKIKAALAAVQAQLAQADEPPDGEEFAWALQQVAANWGEDDPLEHEY